MIAATKPIVAVVGVVLVAGAIACRESAPSADVTPRFPIVDIHTHLGGVEEWPGKRPDFDEILQAMRDRNVELVVDFKAPDNSLRNAVFGERVTERLAIYPDTSRFKLFANVPIDDSANVFLGETRADYSQWVAGVLDDAVRRGASGLKVKDQAGTAEYNYWTTDRRGTLIPFDTPALHRLWQTAARLRVPLLLHLGGAYKAEHQEPKGDKRSVRWEILMLERERVLRKHPHLLVIGAHWGSTGDDPGYLDEMLRRYPNFFVEGGAHHAQDAFAELDSAGLRFFEEFQDRVLFGTDYMENTFRWLKSYRQRLDMFLPYSEKWPLADSVKAKYYHGNARRLLRRSQVNAPPVANAGPSITRPQGERIVLDGSGSYDFDGDSIRFAWRQVSGPRVRLAGMSSPRAELLAAPTGEYAFELITGDRHASGRADTARINVMPRAAWSAENDGRVAIEAEHFATNIPRAGWSWKVDTARAGASGAAYVTAASDAGGETLPWTFRRSAAELQYPIWIETSGTYVVHLRGQSPDSLADGVHVGLDGEEARLADRIGGFPSADWGWVHEATEWNRQFGLVGRNLAVLNIAEPGAHVLNVWTRRPGFMLDKIVLVRHAHAQVSFPLYDPGPAMGPPESARRSAPAEVNGVRPQ